QGTAVKPLDYHGWIVQSPTATDGDCPPVSPTFTRAAVDPNDPARLGEAHAPLDQRGVLLPLRRLRRGSRPTPPRHRNSSNPRVLRLSLESADQAVSRVTWAIKLRLPDPAVKGPRSGGSSAAVAWAGRRQRTNPPAHGPTSAPHRCRGRW